MMQNDEDENLKAFTRALLESGVDAAEFDRDMCSALLGYQFDVPPEASLTDFLEGGTRFFGRSNPEIVEIPFWKAMVRSGASAGLATLTFEKERKALVKNARKANVALPQIFTGPVWCFSRFGQTITPIDNGCYISIAGEHEDFYDTDFCIYNDVILHDGKGDCIFHTYPRELFPPTDFHSATRVGNSVFIIGNLGYPEDRKSGYTPVFKLDIPTMRMDRLETTGHMPGWIYKHKAVLNGDGDIVISGGTIWTTEGDKKTFVENTDTFVLSLKTLSWKKS